MSVERYQTVHFEKKGTVLGAKVEAAILEIAAHLPPDHVMPDSAPSLIGLSASRKDEECFAYLFGLTRWSDEENMHAYALRMLMTLASIIADQVGPLPEELAAHVAEGVRKELAGRKS